MNQFNHHHQQQQNDFPLVNSYVDPNEPPKYRPPHLRQNYQPPNFYNKGGQNIVAAPTQPIPAPPQNQFVYAPKPVFYNAQPPFAKNETVFNSNTYMNNAYQHSDNGYNNPVMYQKRQYNNNNTQNGYNNRQFNNSNGDGRSRRFQNGYHHNYVDLSQFLPADYSLEKRMFGDEVKNINLESYADIPIEVTGHEIPPFMETFDNYEFTEIIRNNVKLCQYDNPTPVQKHAIPIVAAQRDLMACAQTGSGKTAAFLIPILNSIYSMSNPVEKFKIENTATGVTNKKSLPIALILAPTRELALQILDEAKKLCYRSNVRPYVVYGGADIKDQIRSLRQYGCQLLVATPGRLIDLYNKEVISFENIKYLVLDEADRMLDMGFEPQIREIVQQKNMPNSKSRQTLMFSATFPKEIQILAKCFLNNYIFLAVGRVGSTNANISQHILWAEENDKRSLLLDLLQSDPTASILIFVETRRSADELEEFLLSENYQAVSIHGDKSQMERERALSAFRNGNKLILVATAVAARGLDIPNVKIVVNFDIPNDIDDYVHRIGRTGRAGLCGESVAFFNEKNRPVAVDLFNLLEETQQVVPEFLKKIVNEVRQRRTTKPRQPYLGNRPQQQYNNNNMDNLADRFGRQFISRDYREQFKNQNNMRFNNNNNSNRRFNNGFIPQQQQQQQQQAQYPPNPQLLQDSAMYYPPANGMYMAPPAMYYQAQQATRMPVDPASYPIQRQIDWFDAPSN